MIGGEVIQLLDNAYILTAEAILAVEGTDNSNWKPFCSQKAVWFERSHTKEGASFSCEQM